MGKIITVNFRGDELYGFEREDGTYVALRPIVEAIGLDWSGQLQRLKRDPILSEGVVIIPTPFTRGGAQEAVCLKFDLVNGWLFTIDSARIKDAVTRERVLVYQRECYRVLFKHFYGEQDSEKPVHETESVRVRMVSEARQTFGTRVASHLWLKLQLPFVPSMVDGTSQADLFDYARMKTINHEPGAAA
jgi:hypothetical protein